jgi:hypothetical protein
MRGPGRRMVEVEAQEGRGGVGVPRGRGGGEMSERVEPN